MIAKTIAKYIEENGIKQVFLCEKTGLTKHCISMSLKGNRKISIEEYERICLALNVPYEYFFNRNNETNQLNEKNLSFEKNLRKLVYYIFKYFNHI